MSTEMTRPDGAAPTRVAARRRQARRMVTVLGALTGAVGLGAVTGTVALAAIGAAAMFTGILGSPDPGRDLPVAGPYATTTGPSAGPGDPDLNGTARPSAQPAGTARAEQAQAEQGRAEQTHAEHGRAEQDRAGAPAAPATGTDAAPRHVPCTADELIAAVDRANRDRGATLKLTDGCVYTLRTSAEGTGLPTVTAPITILGGDSVIGRGDGAGPFRLFDVAPGGRLTLVSVTLKGGRSDSGGAIRIQAGGSALLRRSTLTDNVSTTDGGALANQGVTVLEQSTVRDNSAAHRGGGVHNEAAGTVTIDGASQVVRNRPDNCAGPGTPVAACPG